MPVNITVNPEFGGEIYLPSIKKVLRSGQSVVLQDAVANNSDVQKALSKKIIIIAADPADHVAQVEYDELQLNPNERFRIKNLTNRNMSVQGLSDMLTPHGAIYISYDNLTSGFIGSLIRSGTVEITDLKGNYIVLNEGGGFKKVSPDTEEDEVELLEEVKQPKQAKEAVAIDLDGDDDDDDDAPRKISLKSQEQVLSQFKENKKKKNFIKDPYMPGSEDVIDPLFEEKQKGKVSVWNAESQQAEEGVDAYKAQANSKPIKAGKEKEEGLPSTGEVVVIPNKLSVKSKNDIAEVLSKKEAKTEEKPVKTAKKKSTKKKTTKKKSTSKKKRSVPKKDGIDEVVEKLTKKKPKQKISIKAVGSERPKTTAEEVDDSLILHNNESIFVDQEQDIARIRNHPLLKGQNRQNE